MKDQLSGRVGLGGLFDRSSAASAMQSLALRGASTFTDDGVACVTIGAPRCQSDPAPTRDGTDRQAKALLRLWKQHGSGLASHIQGAYALVIVDSVQACVYMAVDRFGIETLCYRIEGNDLSFSDRADGVAGRGRELDPQALFDYLYFHMIPAPRTIFQSVRRLPAAHALLIDNQGAHLSRHWPLHFDGHHRQPFEAARSNLRQRVRDAVERELEGEQRVGTFLSGGIDSSTVTGMLGQVTGRPAPAYSIGFEAEGYDEMEYARMVARHFGCEHHEYYVTPADLLASIPAVAQHYDQPFGNSSALPTYYCARMARTDGCSKLLAGDGGDELFGGNTRYALHKFLHYYDTVPEGMRRLIEPLCGDGSVLRRIPGLRQATGYVRRAKVPMPRRMNLVNLLMQCDPQTVLAPEFLARIDTNEPVLHNQSTWDACADGDIVNRMLAYDWRYTLADSDLHKVRGATSLAGLHVAYPLLDDGIAAFSMQLEPAWKLKRLQLRWFFKEAMRGFLPDAVLTKKKQGFGLPYGVWLTRSPELRRLALDSLGGLAERNIVQQKFVTHLMDHQLKEHPGYYGGMVWILMMLEQWMRGQGDVSLPA